MGVVIDARLNDSAASDASTPIHADEARVQIWVVPTDEELQIAREIRRLLRPK